MLLAAGVLSIIVGLIHSVLGELLIFKNLREHSIIPTVAMPPLRERNIRILWATWHATTVFGWVIGAILINMAYTTQVASVVVIQLIAISMFAASALVFLSTKAKHPGWVGLLVIAILCWLS